MIVISQPVKHSWVLGKSYNIGSCSSMKVRLRQQSYKYCLNMRVRLFSFSDARPLSLSASGTKLIVRRVIPTLSQYEGGVIFI